MLRGPSAVAPESVAWQNPSQYLPQGGLGDAPPEQSVMALPAAAGDALVTTPPADSNATPVQYFGMSTGSDVSGLDRIVHPIPEGADPEFYRGATYSFATAPGTPTPTPAPAPITPGAPAPVRESAPYTPQRRASAGMGASAGAQQRAAHAAEYRAAGERPDDTFSADLAGLQGRINETAAQGAERRASLIEQQNSAAQEAEAARQARMQQAEADIDRRITEVENMRVDPNNWFSSRGVVGSIGAAIAVGLGAAAQSLQGNGPNNALGIINSAIDRDIAAQNENMRNAGTRLQNRENSLGRLRQQFGDQRSAEEAFRARSLMIAENQILAMAARAATPTQREALAELKRATYAQRMQSSDTIRAHMLQQQATADMAAAARAARGTGQPRQMANTEQNRMQRDRFAQELRSAGMSEEQILLRVRDSFPIAGTAGAEMVPTVAGGGSAQGGEPSSGGPSDALRGGQALLYALRNGTNVPGTTAVANRLRNSEGVFAESGRALYRAAGNTSEQPPAARAMLERFHEIRRGRAGTGQSAVEMANLAETMGKFNRADLSQADYADMTQRAVETLQRTEELDAEAARHEATRPLGQRPPSRTSTRPR